MCLQAEETDQAHLCVINARLSSINVNLIREGQGAVLIH